MNVFLDQENNDISADDIISRNFATFFMRMSRDIPQWNLYKDDFLVIDKGEAVAPNELFVTYYKGEYRIFMMAPNGHYYRPDCFSNRVLPVWGKVTNGIRKFR